MAEFFLITSLEAFAQLEFGFHDCEAIPCSGYSGLVSMKPSQNHFIDAGQASMTPTAENSVSFFSYIRMVKI